MKTVLLLMMALLIADFGDEFKASSQPHGSDPQTRRDNTQPAFVGSDDPTYGLLGSKHDFAPRSAPLIDHCAACHGRPNAAASQPHRTTSSQPALAFAFYSRRPHASTVLCLSCHDGTLSSFINADGIAPVPPRAHVDGAHDHPVGIAYPKSNREYRPAALVEQRGIRLPEGRVECVSCHDPHDPLRQPNMLVISNRRSALCLTCHLK